MRRRITVLAVTAVVTAGTGLAWIVTGHAPAPPRSVAVAKGPQFDAPRLRREIGAYLRQRPGRAGVMATDLRSGLAFGANETSPFVTASVIKVDILAALLLQRQWQGLGLSDAERALAGRMIRRSDNNAADALYADVGRDAGVDGANTAFGLVHTDPYPVSWGSSWTTPSDQVRLVRLLASDRGPLVPQNRRFVLDLMGSVVPEQRWGISAAARPGERVALKNGWVRLHEEGHGWAVNSIGRITGPDHDFLIAVFSGDSPTMRDGVTTVERVAAMVVSTLRGTDG